MKRFLRKMQGKRSKKDVPRNEYYENISARLGILQVVLYLSLFAFVILSFFKNTELITYRNFYRFFKDLNASAESVFVPPSESITYPVSNEQSFTLYRKGLAVAGNSTVTVFSTTGRQTISQSISYQNPIAVGAGKYLLVYELGGLQYSLYSSYTQVFTGSCEYPITGAAVSDSGMYAIVSSSDTYTSVVSLYSDNFSLLNKYNKTGYVMDVSINSRGSQLAILTILPENGAFSTELMLCRPGEGTSDAKKTLEGTVGWDCEFMASDDAIAVLHESGVAYYSAKGEQLSTFSFLGKEPLAVDMSRDGVALYLPSAEISKKNMLIVFDKSGKMLYNEGISGEVRQIARSGNSLYWMSNEGVHRLNLKNGSVDFSSCNVFQKRLLAPSEAEALICSPQKAEYIKFTS
ncbi:MAG: hypothetical protein E7629_03310 [Ruminococcaceae bacterium]|nr:hypothetical protein [Oscillospiraceae bacterium]